MAQDDTSQIATANTSPRLRILSFPAEIRNMTYRLLFCFPDPIPTEDMSYKKALSSQLLRTCKTVYNEAASILYAENIFTIELSSRDAPDQSSAEYSKALGILFGWGSRPSSQVMREHLRSFLIKIDYTSAHQLTPLRDSVRQFTALLGKHAGQIKHLRLECALDFRDSSSWVNWRDERWDSYEHDGSKKQCIAALRTWLGALDVENGETWIEGMPEGDAEILKGCWRGDGREELMRFIGDFKALEKAVNFLDSCKEGLYTALLCFEAGNEEMFNAWKDDICEQLRGHVEDWANAGLLQGVSLDTCQEKEPGA
ncbi:hypothetical protein B0T14DRAFT_583362 [Immersiella caudata]|uniref:Uncharacterized protein n=1 Tax=Immersiella caudata TaxID=314043 RepID=A0AA39WYU1_9PEZI|nr:hypothetical protein B0T14DRAFT_583362 [Immersiella caudata]